MPAISVIIPTLNEEHYIRRALDSLRKQTFKDFEILVVDSHSKDATVKIAKRYGTRIMTAVKRGPWRAKKAHGKLLLFLDADTRIPKDFLSVINETFKNPRTALMGPEVRMDADVYYRILLKLVYMAFKALELFNRAPAVMAVACRKKDFLRVRFPPRQLGEDVEFSRAMSTIGNVTTRSYCITSPRRFEREGFLCLCAIYAFSLIEFLLTGRMSHRGYDFGTFKKP